MTRDSVLIAIAAGGILLGASGWLRPMPAKVDSDREIGQKWTYLALTMDQVLNEAPQGQNATLGNSLDFLGRQGWQLISIAEIFPSKQAAKERTTAMTFIFMRPTDKYYYDPLPPTEEDPPPPPAGAPLIQEFNDGKSRSTQAARWRPAIIGILVAVGVIWGIREVWRRTSSHP